MCTPFPARMPPQLALDALEGVRPGARVLDPMCGSGTVLLAALELRLDAVGRDIDPLAVLMSRVATTKVVPQDVLQQAEDVISRAQEIERSEQLTVREIDGDPKALAFVRFWYAPQQERQLRALTCALPPGDDSVNRPTSVSDQPNDRDQDSWCIACPRCVTQQTA